MPHLQLVDMWRHKPLISAKYEYLELVVGYSVDDSEGMLTEIYIEALLVDEELADEVWEVWDAGEIDDAVAYTAWILIAAAGSSSA